MREMKGTATLMVRAPSSLASADVVPAKGRAFVAEPSVVVRGFPSVPRYWASARGTCSATGMKVTSRDEPTDVQIEAHSRFIAHTFDDLAGVWTPYETFGVDYLMTSPPGLEPSLEEFEYTQGKELIRRPALRFNPGDYLTTSFNNGVDDAAAFTVVLVISPSIPTGYTVFATKDAQGELSLSLGSAWTLSYGGRTVELPVGRMLHATPCYLVLSYDGVNATAWAGTSTRNLVSRSIRHASGDIAQLEFLIGKTHQGKASATMLVHEFLLFNQTLVHHEVVQTVALLSSTYGGV